MKNILFITTHNLATNPRLVKEINLAIENHFDVSVICFEFNNWSYDFNQKIKQRFTDKGVALYIIDASRKSFLKWAFYVGKEKLSRSMAAIYRSNKNTLATAASRRHKQIMHMLRNIQQKPDLVVGHNPGALYATLKAAQRFSCKTGFDMEDYHLGEGTNKRAKANLKRLMQACLPSFDYISYAAPLIKTATEKDFKGELKNGFTILNYFPSNEFVAPEKGTATAKISLVWFSQNVNKGRGLELILPYIKKYADRVDLHLIGAVNPSFQQEFMTGISNIIYHGSLPQIELNERLAEFDIGLALEVPVDRNRELVLTNKILSYMQAGLYVVATNTEAQVNYLSAYPNHGIAIDFVLQESYQTLEHLFNEIDLIRKDKLKRYIEFVNKWEDESKLLLSVWDKVEIVKIN